MGMVTSINQQMKAWHTHIGSRGLCLPYLFLLNSACTAHKYLPTCTSKLPALLTACSWSGKYWLHFTMPASVQLVSISTTGTCVHTYNHAYMAYLQL